MSPLYNFGDFKMRNIEALKAEFTFHRQLFTVATAVASGTTAWLVNHTDHSPFVGVIAVTIIFGGFNYARIRYKHVLAIIMEMAHV